MHGSNPGQGIWFGPDVFAADILDLADNLRFEYHFLKMFTLVVFATVPQSAGATEAMIAVLPLAGTRGSKFLISEPKSGLSTFKAWYSKQF